MQKLVTKEATNEIEQICTHFSTGVCRGYDLNVLWASGEFNTNESKAILEVAVEQALRAVQDLIWPLANHMTSWREKTLLAL